MYLRFPAPPQPIREEIIHEPAKVRRLYPTLERKNSRQNNLVYRSESKRCESSISVQNFKCITRILLAIDFTWCDD
jgi:hypothetical protein